MMKNITLSANKFLIQQAQRKTVTEKTTLNQLFHEWLTSYVVQQTIPDHYDALMEQFSHVQVGDIHFDRESMNERN